MNDQTTNELFRVLPPEELAVVAEFFSTSGTVFVTMSKDDTASVSPYRHQRSDGSYMETVGELRKHLLETMKEHPETLQKAVEAGALKGSHVLRFGSEFGGENFFRELLETPKGDSFLMAAVRASSVESRSPRDSTATQGPVFGTGI